MDDRKLLQPHAESSSGVSRRAFLRGSGAVAAATATALTGQTTVAAPPPAIVGPEPVEINLQINGETMKLRVEPRVTLLDALRNHLDLTGAKKVCDRGTCGACTVIVDGKPAYACSILAIDAVGRKIETVEGLGANHPVVRAFVNHDGLQCGFCTPGFVMACTAFCRSHANANTHDVEHGLGGNLCRCGTYVGIREAAVEAAAKMKGGR